MHTKRVVGVIGLIFGISLVLFSIYIMHHVGIGKVKIANAQEKLNEGTGFILLNPIAKNVSKGAVEEAEGKIEQGQKDVVFYEEVAEWLEIGGIVIGVIGAGLIAFPKRKK